MNNRRNSTSKRKRVPEASNVAKELEAEPLPKRRKSSKATTAGDTGSNSYPPSKSNDSEDKFKAIIASTIAESPPSWKISSSNTHPFIHQ